MMKLCPKMGRAELGDWGENDSPRVTYPKPRDYFFAIYTVLQDAGRV